jgi:hypothetical protein
MVGCDEKEIIAEKRFYARIHFFFGRDFGFIQDKFD